MRQLPFVAQDKTRVEFVTRGEDGAWRSVFRLEPAASPEIAEPLLSLPLADIYATLPSV